MAQSPRASRSAAAPAARPRPRSHARASTVRAPAPATESGDAVAGPAPDDLRRRWIAEAAYYIAERRGFGDGSADDDWCRAEAEIDRLLARIEQ